MIIADQIPSTIEIIVSMCEDINAKRWQFDLG